MGLLDHDLQTDFRQFFWQGVVITLLSVVGIWGTWGKASCLLATLGCLFGLAITCSCWGYWRER